MEIVPSILTADPHECRSRLRQASRFSRSAQVDFIDGRFIPGRATVAPDALIDQDFDEIELTAHLLTFKPMPLLDSLAKARFRRVIFHIEATGEWCGDPSTPSASVVIEEARRLGFAVGLGKNPATPLGALEPWRRLVDEWLFLAVDPARPGVFIPRVIEDVARGRKLHPNMRLSLDGGLGRQNIAHAARSGADIAYVGHGIFDIGESARANFTTLSRIARAHRDSCVD